jgi:ABC-type uncharacterized transport system ATPase subunit
MIQVNNLQKTYNNRIKIDTLEIKRRKLWLSGNNGAGKTTFQPLLDLIHINGNIVNNGGK